MFCKNRYQFENACGVGDLETVERFFDDVNRHVDILRLRNWVAQGGYLNILKYFYRQII